MGGGGKVNQLFSDFFASNLKIRPRDYQNRIQRPRFTPVGVLYKEFLKKDPFMNIFGSKI